MLCCLHSSLEIAKILLDHEADPNIPDLNGKTPLLVSVSQRSAQMVSLLIQYGADPNTGFVTDFVVAKPGLSRFEGSPKSTKIQLKKISSKSLGSEWSF